MVALDPRMLPAGAGAGGVQAEHGGQFVDRPLAGGGPEAGVRRSGPPRRLVGGGRQGEFLYPLGEL